MLTSEVHIAVPGWVAIVGLISIALFWWSAFWFLYGFVRGATKEWRRRRAMDRFLEGEGPVPQHLVDDVERRWPRS